MSTIEKRVEKLESKLRFYQLAFIATIFVAGFFIFTAFKNNVAPDLIQAKEFQVVDDNGKVLVSMKKDTTGGGHVNIYNQAGTSVLYMNAGYQGGRIALSDNNGNSGMVAAITDEGHGVLNVYNKFNKRINAVGGDAGGNGVVNVYNNAGEKMNGIWPKE